jgi:predicted small metal-binding protein
VEVLYAWYIYSAHLAASNGSGGAVAKTITCAHGGIVCNATVRGDSEEDVLEKALTHARDDHGVNAAESKTLTNYLRSLIREDTK